MNFSPRHVIWINLILLAAVAYWAAAAVNSAIAARFAVPVDVTLSDPPPPIGQTQHRPQSHYAAIHTRDIFTSTKPETAPPPAPPPAAPKPTELKLKLWGVALRDTQEASYCIIEDLTQRKQSLYRVNEMVADVARVKRVEWERVILDRSGKEEILELASPAGAGNGKGNTASSRVNRVAAVRDRRTGTGARSRPGSARAGTAGGNNAAATESGIEELGDGRYLIDRSEVESALDNMNQLLTQVRAVPHFKGGKATGFRLFAIRQNSIFDRIGLRNGDILQNINGNELNDPAKAVTLLQELRDAGDITVEVVRNREPKTLSYQFR